MSFLPAAKLASRALLLRELFGQQKVVPRIAGKARHLGIVGNATQLLAGQMLGRVGKTLQHFALVEIAEKAVPLVGSAVDALVASTDKALLVGAGKARVASVGYKCPMGEQTDNVGSDTRCPTDSTVRTSWWLMFVRVGVHWLHCKLIPCENQCLHAQSMRAKCR